LHLVIRISSFPFICIGISTPVLNLIEVHRIQKSDRRGLNAVFVLLYRLQKQKKYKLIEISAHYD